MGTNEPLPHGEEFLTVQQAALKAGIGETAIRNAILRKRLPETLMYGRKLIKASDLASYIEFAKPGRPRKILAIRIVADETTRPHVALETAEIEVHGQVVPSDDQQSASLQGLSAEDITKIDEMAAEFKGRLILETERNRFKLTDWKGDGE